MSSLVRAYADSGLIDKALEIYCLLQKVHSCLPDVLACNSLLNVLVNNGKLGIARKVYSEMVDRDNGDNVGCINNFSVSIMVKGLCKEGKVEEGRKMIEDRWGRGCIPNVVFYNILIDGYVKKGDLVKAAALHKELNRKGFLPTIKTWGSAINGFCRAGKFEMVDKLIDEMKE